LECQELAALCYAGFLDAKARISQLGAETSLKVIILYRILFELETQVCKSAKYINMFTPYLNCCRQKLVEVAKPFSPLLKEAVQYTS